MLLLVLVSPSSPDGFGGPGFVGSLGERCALHCSNWKQELGWSPAEPGGFFVWSCLFREFELPEVAPSK